MMKRERRSTFNRWMSVTVTWVLLFSSGHAFTVGIHGQRHPMPPTSTILRAASSSFRMDSPKSSNSISSTPQFIRWLKSDSVWKMQSAVTTFQRNHKEIVELHAQLHYGSFDYFDYYNDNPSFATDDSTVVCYELLIDQDMLSRMPTSDHGVKRCLKKPISASPFDQKVAASYGWSCQADVIDYSQFNWIHADFTRQELLERVSQDSSSATTQQQPLWRLVKKQQKVPEAALEAATALFVGPPPLLAQQQQQQLQRRLFTNLFLPGDSLATVLRMLLWWTVPSPELSILLLDWSSLLKGQQWTFDLFLLLMQGQLNHVRQVLFGQAVVTAAAAANGKQQQEQQQDWSLLVTERNDRALQVVEQEFMATGSNTNKVALLYGCHHCPDLHSKLVSRGFVPIKKEWRTAWHVPVVSKTSNSAWLVFVAALLFPSYLMIGGMDWIATLHDMAEAATAGNWVDCGLGATLYLIRHVLLYVALSKFALDWDSPATTSDNNNRA